MTTKIAIIGIHEYTPYLLSEITNQDNINIRVIISQSDASINDTKIKEIVDLSDTRIHSTETINTKKVEKIFQKEDVEVGICLGWYEIIEEQILTIPKYGIIGIHASPLPQGRGQAPVNYQILYGYEEATVSVFQLTPEVDAGALYGQKSIPIFEQETVSSLYDRLLYYGINIFKQSIRSIADGTINIKSQSDENATYWPERRPCDSLIDWNFTSLQLDRFVRALTDPYPNAFTYVKDKRVKICSTTPYPKVDTGLNPGEIIETDSTGQLIVQTGSGAIGIERAGVGDEPILRGSELSDRLNLTNNEIVGKQSDFPVEFTYIGLRGPDGRTDLNLETNISLEETAKNILYCFVPNSQRKIKITASTVKQTLLNESFTISGIKEIPIEYSPKSTKSRLVKVNFDGIPKKTIRYYIYSHKGH